MIPIYKYETKDGIADAVRSSGRLIFASQAKWLTPNKDSAVKITDLLKASSTANPNQIDLFYIESVLASVGWNKNDDVFDAKEIWVARQTPVDKQFNYMHDETDIIGHLTSSKIVDFNGNVITEESALPNQFDIVVGSVLYKKWSDPQLQERMNKLIAEITDDKWCVSMECLFRNFDYAIITDKGEHKVLARNDESSFLTKHLRIYGGSGAYEGYRVGRLLRGFSFSGKGLVDNPANPRSKITTYNDKSEISSFTGAAATVEELEISNEELNSMTISQEQYDALEAKYQALLDGKADEAQKELDTAKTTIVTLEKKVANVTDELEASKEVAKAKDESIEASEAKLKEVEAKLSEAEEKIAAQELEAIKASRKTALLAKVEEDKADALVDKFANASNEMFEALVESLPAKKMEDDKTKDKKDKKNQSKASDDSNDDDSDDADASVETDIDDASASDDADMSSGGDDVPADKVAKAASWFTNHVLRATANKKEGE